MLTRRLMVSGGVLAILAAASTRWWGRDFGSEAAEAAAEPFPVAYSDAEWRKRLTPAQYAVLRRSGTEVPFTSPLNSEHRAGIFACAGCDNDAFDSATKFDSHTGWPSFWKARDGAVGEVTDRSFGMARTAVHCSRCGGHLGHVFDDGPQPTGLRYCMNGVALQFKPSGA